MIDVIPLSKAGVTLDMLDELHGNLTILYESDQLEGLSYSFKEKWEDLVDLGTINSAFIPLIEEAYDNTALLDEEDDESSDISDSEIPPEELEW